jgi:hypothetical protein
MELISWFRVFFFQTLDRSHIWAEDGELEQVESLQFSLFLLRNSCYSSEAIPKCLLFSMSKPEVYPFGRNNMEHRITLLDISMGSCAKAVSQSN